MDEYIPHLLSSVANEKIKCCRELIRECPYWNRDNKLDQSAVAVLQNDTEASRR